MLTWVTKLTQKFEERAVASKAAYHMLEKYYQDTIENEATLANVTAKDHILCIGGGTCPLSAILFHQVTGAKVTVIDHNGACIPKARQVIKALGLVDKVQVLHQEATCKKLDLASFTVVHLALQVSPLNQVLAFIKDQAAPGTKILVRRPKKTLKSLYCRLSQGVLAGCPYTTHRRCNIGHTLLYVKEAAA